MDTRCFKLVEVNDTEDLKVPPVVAGLQHFNSKVTPGSVNTTSLHLLHVGIAPIRTALEQAPGTTFASSSSELGGTHWSNIEHCADLLNVAILCSPKLLRDFVSGSGPLQGGIFVPSFRFAVQCEMLDGLHSLELKVRVGDDLKLGSARGGGH